MSDTASLGAARPHGPRVVDGASEQRLRRLAADVGCRYVCQRLPSGAGLALSTEAAQPSREGYGLPGGDVRRVSA